VRWKIEWTASFAATLRAIGGVALLADGRGNLFAIDPARGDLAAWRRTALPRGMFQPRDPSLFVARGGDVLRIGDDLAIARVWNTGVEDATLAEAHLVERERLLVLVGDREQREVSLIDLAAGSPMWRGRATWTNVLVGGRAIVAARGWRTPRVVAIDVDTGDERWEREFPGSLGAAIPVAVAGLRAWAHAGGRTLDGLSLDDGTLRSVPLAASDPRVIVDGRARAVALTGDLHVQRVDLVSATSERDVEIGAGQAGWPVCVAGDRVVVRDRKGALLSVDLASGAVAPIATLGDNILGGAIVGDALLVLAQSFTDSDDHSLSCFTIA
jgi:outer membrane protein assembly factor BamB